MTSFAFQPHQPENEGATNNNAPLVEPAGRFVQLIVRLEPNTATYPDRHLDDGINIGALAELFGHNPAMVTEPHTVSRQRAAS